MAAKQIFFALIVLMTSSCFAQNIDVEKLAVPAGFSISVYAEVPGARQMALGSDNTVYVGSNRGGNVFAVIDNDGDKQSDSVITIARGLNAPNGVAYHEGDLFIGEINRISKISDVDSRLTGPQSTETVNASLPNRRAHGFKYLKIGPDGKLYIPIGAPCNVCEEDEIFAGLHSMNLDGSGMQKIASGIRNSVGFDWHPVSGELWFTDNGRDMLGDDVPACEINRISSVGQHFGFPYFHQGDLPDPNFGRGRRASDFTPPVFKLGAHVAPLGLAFYRGSMFPSSYSNTVFVAEHGSWNRSQKNGYRVMMGKVSADNMSVLEYTPFIEGWLEGQVNWGRPVDVLMMPDGAVLVSDDLAGVIYRIEYNG